MTTTEFFDKLIEEEMGEVDILNCIEKISGNNLEKLTMLFKDIEINLCIAIGEKEAEFTKDDINVAIQEYEKRGMKVPMKHFPEIRGKDGQIAIQAFSIIDKEALLFKYEFFPVYQAMRQIKSLIQQHDKTSNALKPPKLTAQIISLFCYYVNEIKLSERGESETAEAFCQRVCETWSLKYTDRVRQNYGSSVDTKRNRKTLAELLLPNIKDPEKSLVIKHLEKKDPPTQKLYA